GGAAGPVVLSASEVSGSAGQQITLTDVSVICCPALPLTSLALSTTGPAAPPVTAVDTIPLASVCSVHVVAPAHAANPAVPETTANCTLAFAIGVTPSAFCSCTANGIAAVMPVSNADGCSATVITSGCTDEYTNPSEMSVCPPVATSITITSTGVPCVTPAEAMLGTVAMIWFALTLTTVAVTPFTRTWFP